MKIVCAGRGSETWFYNFGAHKQAELGKKINTCIVLKRISDWEKNLGSS